ncbi:unnamed protein product [Cylicocyclus nassatus]|uniref:Uncharacterized protein n=1 Tax=Cylicocyclus nassatus TaxID=53992 RepID=A0AA36GWS5_CYLNA|nr:unnamed protein product [Cylicocyclus nassatus]
MISMKLKNVSLLSVMYSLCKFRLRLELFVLPFQRCSSEVLRPCSRSIRCAFPGGIQHGLGSRCGTSLKRRWLRCQHAHSERNLSEKSIFESFLGSKCIPVFLS